MPCTRPQVLSYPVSRAPRRAQGPRVERPLYPPFCQLDEEREFGSGGQKRTVCPLGTHSLPPRPPPRMCTNCRGSFYSDLSGPTHPTKKDVCINCCVVGGQPIDTQTPHTHTHPKSVEFTLEGRLGRPPLRTRSKVRMIQAKPSIWQKIYIGYSLVPTRPERPHFSKFGALSTESGHVQTHCPDTQWTRGSNPVSCD